MILFEISREAFLPFLVASFIFGIIFGAIYDIFRIRRIAFRGKGRILDSVLTFFEDIVFFLFISVCLILICYKLHFGIPRWYSYIGALLGFFLYRNTVGRLVISVSDKIISLIERVLLFIKKRLILPVFGLLKALFGRLFYAAKRKYGILYTKKTERKILERILK